MQASQGPRAVVLFGPPGSGKSTLARALLEQTGDPPPSAPEPWRLAVGVAGDASPPLWLLDPPGHPDLAGELAAGLRAAAAAVLVLSPVQGLDVRTVAVWEALEHLPRLVVLTQLDRPGADADEAVAVCRRLLGETVLPVQLPLHDDDGAVGGLLDLAALVVVEGRERRPAEPEHATLVEAVRDELLEAVLTGSDDEDLFAAFRADSAIAPARVTAELPAAVARQDLQPVLVAVPARGVGLPELAALLRALPVQPEVPAAADSRGVPVDPPPGMREVVRGGDPALARVWTGPGAGGLVDVPGEHPPGAVVGAQVRLAPWPAPVAQLPVGVRHDDGLALRVARDPVARLAADPRTGQLLLWALGPAHAELLLAGLPSQPVALPPGPRGGRVRVTAPAWAARAVRSELVARGGEVLAERADDDGTSFEVRLPAPELVHLAATVARASSGTARLERLDGPLSGGGGP